MNSQATKSTTAMRLRHYGADKFDRTKFDPIRDDGFVKPRGGLWTSPVNSAEGWKHWCEAEGFAVRNLETFFDVDFTGRVLVIDSVRDLDALEWINLTPLGHVQWPVFESLLGQGFDAVHLTARGQWATRFSMPRSLYGWDCESVLVLNPDCLTHG